MRTLVDAAPLQRAAAYLSLLTGAWLLSASATPAHACAVCFGDPNSEMVRGAKAGVIVLAAFAYFVVLVMVGFAGVWAYRARKLSLTPGASPPDPATPQPSPDDRQPPSENDR